MLKKSLTNKNIARPLLIIALLNFVICANDNSISQEEPDAVIENEFYNKMWQKLQVIKNSKQFKLVYLTN
ncbi:hypothetical protein BX611_1084 [Lutibacter oceani]|uniref:Uncharacterized protein n=1 Tax=Lutibacter oceani TaxID=1853311 RepID=A0A3D9RUX6_9FLAO|nr:hypothetical protein BX611_1084 [Lutibacter oceani]